jgi:hypothetical protein
MRHGDSRFRLSDSLPRLLKANSDSDVPYRDGRKEDRREQLPARDRHRARKLARTLLQEEEERGPVFDAPQQDAVIASYQKLVFPVDPDRKPYFSSLPLEVILRPSICISIYVLGPTLRVANH